MTRLQLTPLPGGVVQVQLVSLDGLNRLTLDLLRELAELPSRPQATGFVVCGNDRCFSAGADLAAMAALSPAEAWRLAREGQRHLSRIASSPVPFVAAVAGHCLGGGFDLALSCSARICTPAAYFGHHGARLGLITGWRGTQTLPRLLGPARALDHLLAAQGWPAELALVHGLVRQIVPSFGLLAAAAVMANKKRI